MNRILKSLVVTAAAVPFLVAAPAVKQNSSASNQTQTAPAKAKHAKKHSKKSAAGAQAASTTSSQAK